MNLVSSIFESEVKEGLSSLRKELKLGEKEAEEFDQATERLIRYSLMLLSAKTEEERTQIRADISHVRTTLTLITAIKSARVANKIIETTWSVALKLFMTIII